jgi:hypothetical protein
MLASPRWGAKIRCGDACRSLAVHGRKRCRMHGRYGDSALNYEERQVVRFGGQTFHKGVDRVVWSEKRNVRVKGQTRAI